MFRETEDIWRLYCREWVIVHTVTQSAPSLHPVLMAARQWVDENLIGRVNEDDIKLVGNTDLGNLFWVHVQLFRDNLKGEFKHHGAAENYARGMGFEEYTIVPRNSKNDHEIRSYGVRKL